MYSRSHFKFTTAIQMTPAIGTDLATLRSGPIVQEAILIVHQANPDGSIDTASCIYTTRGNLYTLNLALSL